MCIELQPVALLISSFFLFFPRNIYPILKLLSHVFLSQFGVAPSFDYAKDKLPFCLRFSSNKNFLSIAFILLLDYIFLINYNLMHYQPTLLPFFQCPKAQSNAAGCAQQ